ncbi:MAG TPA: GTP 3',8-cyclase MoaA [Gemmatimonadales bacterium]|nr:GTP 3',8-cyclase MoaA [Gemmatimonadales bacterium]
MIVDRLERPLGSLRVSVTDRCNMRCRYCMPEQEYVWLPRQSILTFEEIARLVGVFTSLGVQKVRLTGGEPLLRHDLPTLTGMLARITGVHDLAMTTNGLLLGKQADPLRRAGLQRVTISLDTLRPERMRDLARTDRHADVLEGIVAAREAGFKQLKLNAVVIRGVNDDELVELVEFARAQDAEVRFIEYMDVGGATGWSAEQVLSQREILVRLSSHYGTITAVNEGDRAAPADRFRLPDGTTFGIIASTTAPFCRSCDRSRLTADGTWFLCLYAERGIDLRQPLRDGASDADLINLIAATWQGRTDRGAETRLAVAGRAPLYRVEGLRADPHREMHTRGG